MQACSHTAETCAYKVSCGKLDTLVQSCGSGSCTSATKRFIEELTRESSPASSFVIRKDSYTDKNTGVSHIYARQYMHGIEVADGDINVNVKDGVVLSYGDSVRVPSGRVSVGC